VRRVPARGGVVLVSMPWEDLNHPSVQLGTLKALLAGAGLPVETRAYKIDFVEHCLAAFTGADALRIQDYQALAEYSRSGIAEWVFAVPPYLDTSAADEKFFEAIGCSPALRRLAERLRSVVPGFLEACAADLLAAAPAVVGFSSTFAQNIPSLVLARIVKARAPSVRIVFGGSNCEGPMGAALHRAFPWIDVVVRGEAERVAVPLMEDLLAGRTPRPAPGLCYRSAEGPVAVDHGGEPVAMAEVPFPDFSEYFARVERAAFYPAIASQLRIAHETSRGCWWGERSHCTFCGLNGLTMAFRSKPAARVLDELRELARQTSVLDFVMTDNIVDLAYFRDVFPALARDGHDYRLFYEVKSNLRREQVRLLREAGVICIQPGIESLSTPVLKLMGKGVTAFQNIRLLKWCAEYGIRPAWNVIFGFPREPAEEYARMAEVMRGLTHLEPPDLTRLAVHRFSPYHTRPGQLGIEVTGPEAFYGFLYPAEPADVADIAYRFTYRHLDGRDPLDYVGPVKAVVDLWRAGQAGDASLRYRRGPGFVDVVDRRPGIAPARYLFEDVEARIFDACEDGATPAEVVAALGADAPDEASVRQFLDELVETRLVYAEGGRYLALALPMSYAPPPIVSAPPAT
jgi:ribosomal peptide maturation radical SAM protein 1